MCMNPMLSDRRPHIYCMPLSLGSLQNRQRAVDRKLMSGCLRTVGWGGEHEKAMTSQGLCVTEHASRPMRRQPVVSRIRSREIWEQQLSWEVGTNWFISPYLISSHLIPPHLFPSQRRARPWRKQAQQPACRRKGAIRGRLVSAPAPPGLSCSSLWAT